MWLQSTVVTKTRRPSRGGIRPLFQPIVELFLYAKCCACIHLFLLAATIIYVPSPFPPADKGTERLNPGSLGSSGSESRTLKQCKGNDHAVLGL